MDNIAKKEHTKVLSPLLKLIIGLILLSVAITIILSGKWNTQNATLVVIALTLITLIFYTAATHSIASLDKSRWELENKCKAFYYMKTNEDNEDSILFGIINESILVMRAKVNCNFKIYGEEVEYSDDYNGRNTWYIFPHHSSQGHFEISKLLSKKEKTVPNMIEKRDETNREDQLSMELDIKFRDEYGNDRALPKRRHFFDFKRMRWIPIIAWKDEWED